MFSDNVSKTYNFQDASQEIIIMLLGAFLLGSLLTWLLSKFFSGDYSVENNAYRYENQKNSESNLLRQNTNLQASTTSDVRIVERPTLQKAKIVTAPDDLTKISGIDHKLQSELKTYNITTYADLRDISNADLKAIQGKQQTHKREVETWPHQASLAAKGEWEKLTNYQGFIQRVQNASETSEVSIAKQNKQSKDELTKLVGINPEIEKCLNIQDIHSFKQLSQVDSETLKSHVANINSDIKDHEIESWPHQAAMAEKQQWDELQVYQDFMHSAEPEIADHHIDSAELKHQKSNDNLDHLSDDIQLDGDEANLSDHDDLKKIEGIGPKIEEVLNNGGIYTYSQMQNSNNKRFRHGEQIGMERISNVSRKTFRRTS